MRNALLGCALLASLATPAVAQTPLKTVLFKNGFSLPVFVTSPPNDFNRQFVVEQGGMIRLVKNGVLQANAFLNLGAGGLGLTTASGERGLLGLAFHPQFLDSTSANARRFFVYYTNGAGNNVLARYFASTTNPDLADTTTGQTLLTFLHPSFANHNGGCIQFGPDGYLYIGTGDGGSGNDPSNNAQNVNSYLGKLHRLNVSSGAGAPYGIPANNPYVGIAGLDEIFSIGLRNPWRWGWDRLTGDLYIGDVGQDAVEEIDFQPGTYAPIAGDVTTVRNYGWRCLEGNNQTNLSGCTYPNPYPGTTLVNPIHTYTHSTGRCIIGGYVYRGSAIPDLRGTYFFAEYQNSPYSIWSFIYTGGVVTSFMNRTAELAPGGGMSITFPSSFGEDADGEMYICDRAGGEVFKIVPVTPVTQGLVSYGTGTPGCAGTQTLSANTNPTVKNPGFRLLCNNAPASTLGLGLVTNSQDLAGSDPFGIGALLHVDFFLATQTLTLDFVSDASGNASANAPIPYDPAIIGMTFYAQGLWVESACVIGPYNISTTTGLAITVLP